MAPPADLLELSHCTVDLVRREVSSRGEIQPLTAQEAALLGYLAARAGAVVPLLALQTEVWGYAASVDSAAIAVAVRRLRKKIERDPAAPESLRTVRGIGYVLDLVPVDTPSDTWPPFIGRSETVAALRAESGGVVCLVGPPGIGKTCVAKRFADGWSGPTLFTSLRTCTELDEVVAALGAALEVPPPTTGDGIRWLRHVLRARPGSLWVLDDAETCIGVVVQLLEGLRPVLTEGRRILVTSRVAPAGVPVVPVPPLEVGRSTELFLIHARRARPGLVWSGPEVASVCAALDGVPLAIELAAARLAVLSLAQLHERLSDRLRVLRTPFPGGDPAHVSLEAAIDVSWELLSPVQRRVFAGCAVFPVGFTLDAAEWVLDPADEPLDALQVLRSASLLQEGHRDPSAPVRFQWLPSLAAYAAARLAEDPVARLGFEARHGGYYVAWAGSEPERLPRGRQRLGALGSELSNLEAACRRAVERRDLPVADGAAVPLAEVYGSRGPLEFGARLLDTVLSIGRTPAVLIASSRLNSAAGRVEVAERYAREALVLARAAGDRTHEREALNQIGLAAWRSGDTLGARGHFEVVLEMAREAGDGHAEGAALNCLGITERNLGRVDDAHARYTAALEVCRKAGDQWVECYVLANIAVVVRDRGDLPGARGYHGAALAVSRELGVPRSEAFALCSLGTLSYAAHDLRDARAQFETALDLYRTVGARREEAEVLAYLGEVDRMEGDLDLALERFEESLSIVRELGDRRGEAIELARLGSLFAVRGDRATARQHIEAALPMHRSVGNRRSEGFTLLSLGILDREEARLDEARAHLLSARELARQLHHRALEGAALSELGRVAHEAGCPAEARSRLVEAETLLRGVSLNELVEALCTRAEVEHGLGDRAAAGACLDEARQVAAEIGVEPGSELGQRLAEVGGRLALRGLRVHRRV